MNILSFLNPASIYFKLGIAVVVIIAALSAWIYVQSLRYTVQVDGMQITSLQNTIKAEDAIIKQKDADSALEGKLQGDVAQKLKNAQASVATLQKQLQLTNLSINAANLKTPAMIKALEDKLNQDTMFTERCNELVTGANITPDDAKNTICPDIVMEMK